MNFSAFLNTVTNRSYSLPIVILYVTAGCNMRCVMCSYRDPLPNELSMDELRSLSDSLVRFGLRHIVYSGGEPLLRRDLPDICRLFQRQRVKQSLLTNGLLLSKRYREIDAFFNEIIVSIDGPTAEIHNDIRGIEGFDHILNGIKTVLGTTRRPKISVKTVVQRKNFRHLAAMVEFARSLEVDRISFLAADIHSQAFHRDVSNGTNSHNVILTRDETVELRNIVDRFIELYAQEIKTGFISENKEKLYHLVQYFEALVGTSQFPVNVCNAPMVSAVITSTGDLLPCYFLPSFGSARNGSMRETMNSPTVRKTRRNVKAYALEQCQKCVCTLRVSPVSALAGRF